MYSIEHYEQIVAAFEALLGRINVLCLHIHDDLRNYPAIASDDNGSFLSDRDKIIYALKRFEPNPELSPQETEAFPGAVGCTKRTIELIDSVNAAKDTLKQTAAKYKDVFKGNPTKPIREILIKNGFGPTKLKQIYRHIYYVTYHPKRIAWTKVKAYMNLVISTEEAREALLKAGNGEHIEIQLAKLSLLSPNTKLVKRRDIKPCCAVNLTSHHLGKTHHQKITTSLPIFYIVDVEQEDPIVCFSTKANRGKNSVRSDKKIEDQPFLKSINAYRYQEDLVVGSGATHE